MQGSGYSPTLCNVYLHYVLDTWFRYLKRSAPPDKRFRGYAELVRYADDFVCCFQYKKDAEYFYQELVARFQRYGFELAGEKTRVIRFGRYAAKDTMEDHKRSNTGRTKPDTFNFLGFTFYCSTNDRGHFCCKVKSDAKRVRTKLAKIKDWMKTFRNSKLEVIFKHFNDVLRGYFNYYAVTYNSKCVNAFRYKIICLIFKWLNKRSQRKSYTWEQYNQLLKAYPIVRAYIRVNIIYLS